MNGERETRRRGALAIIVAGPIGLEAALYARALGHAPVVYERGEAGQNVRAWGFVRFFSPWSMNVSRLGQETLQRQGLELPPREACPSGEEYVRHYLDPLARDLGDALRRGVEVLGVSRCGVLKGENVGGSRRARAPFRLLLLVRREDGVEVEEEATASVVLDTSGVFATPCWLGDGGLPAVGERGLQSRIDYRVADVLGARRPEFAGKTTLVVGAGHSAATSLCDLSRLVQAEPRTRVVWVRRSSGPGPFALVDPDPLPERGNLTRRANALAAQPPPGIDAREGVTVRALALDGDRLRVEVRPVEGGGTPARFHVDRVIANVGYRPDLALHRELQVHLCYASEGPMKLAAILLGQGGAGDCLARRDVGPDALLNPERGYFVLGHKSYGRRPDFLLRTGREQIRDVFRLLEVDPALDLYEGDPASARRSRGDEIEEAEELADADE